MELKKETKDAIDHQYNELQKNLLEMKNWHESTKILLRKIQLDAAKQHRLSGMDDDPTKRFRP